jgi:TRAP-type mannitol/chloroaromatic compound transport system substrate-binding protein
VTHWIVKPGFIQPATALEVVVGLKAWDKLPSDIKLIFECAVREWSQYWFSADHLENRKALNKMLEKGLQVVSLNESDLENLRKTAHPIVDKWVSKDPMAQKVWDSQKEYMKLMGKIE